MSPPPVVAVEIGTSWIRAMVGESREDDHLMITGLGECPSRGVRKGEISNFENASRCVRTALDLAEENGRVSIHQVHLLVTGGHISSFVNRGSVPIQGPDHEVMPDDIEHALDHARAASLPDDQEKLHTIRQHFYVDGQDGVVDPLGMEGAKLEVDMLVIHGVRNRLRNLIKAVSSAQVEIEDVVFSGLCSALAVLTPEEKEQGVLVGDLGGGTTDYVVYAGGVIAAAGCFGVGGDHVTNDIARGLHLSTADAEQLKEKEGNASMEAMGRSARVLLPVGTGRAERSIRVADLNTIIYLRMEETLQLLRQRLAERNLLHALGGGVVLTGGGAKMKNITRLAEKVFGLPCRVGLPIGVAGLAFVTESPQYAAPVGMVKYAFKNRREQQKTDGGLKGFLKRWFGG